MWTPAAALLWESWRLSRRLMGILMAIATLGGAALLGSSMSRDASAPLTAVLAGFAAWFVQVRIAIPEPKGFALTLGYTRPIATWKLVTVPLAFVATAAAVTYLVPAVVLRGVFGVDLPLLPMAALSATASLVWVAARWWTGDPVVRRILGISLYLVILGLSQVALWPTANTLSRIASFSAEAYLRMAVISAAALVGAVAGVGRQRRGDDRVVFGRRRAVQSDAQAGRGVTASFIDRLGLRCPVSSATLAQLWFEIRSLGGRIAKSGVAVGFLALVVLSLASAAGAGEDQLVSYVLLGAAMPLFVAVPSVLGLRRKPGHVYMGGFAGTLPLGTARLVGVKVLVASLALFVAWATIAACVWIVVRLRRIQSEYLTDFSDVFGNVASMTTAAIYLIALVAVATALHAFLVVNGKRFLLGALGLALYGTTIVVLVIRGVLDGKLTFELHLAAVAAAFILGTGFLVWRGLGERLFGARAIGVVLAAGLAFALAVPHWMDARRVDEWVAGFLIGILPLAAATLAPWSFSRLRHR